MKDYTASNKFGKGSADYSDRPMYDAVCADCGKACKVPFNPTGEKPVYCSECFDRHRGAQPSRNTNTYSNNRSFDHTRNTPNNGGISEQQFKELITTLSTKLDEVVSLLTLISDKKTLRVAQKGDEKISKKKALIDVVD